MEKRNVIVWNNVANRLNSCTPPLPPLLVTTLAYGSWEVVHVALIRFDQTGNILRKNKQTEFRKQIWFLRFFFQEQMNTSFKAYKKRFLKMISYKKFKINPLQIWYLNTRLYRIVKIKTKHKSRQHK